MEKTKNGVHRRLVKKYFFISFVKLHFISMGRSKLNASEKKIIKLKMRVTQESDKIANQDQLEELTATRKLLLL